MTSVSKIADVLGGEGVLGRRLGTPQELRRAVAEGLPKRSLSHMAKLVVQDPKQQRTVVHRIVPEATFKRRRDRLSFAESEQGRTDRPCRRHGLRALGGGGREGFSLQPASHARR